MGDFTIECYGYRYWAVYDSGELVAVTVYRKGAREVVRRLEQGSEESDEVTAGGADTLQLQPGCPLCQELLTKSG